jgi:hypothetical protein
MTRRTLQRLALLCVVGATAFGVTGGVANADKPSPNPGPGSCPNSTWSPLAVDQTNATEVKVDKNGNGWICVKDTGGGNGAAPNLGDDNSHSNQ